MAKAKAQNVSKETLVEKVASKTGASKKEVNEMLTVLLDTIMAEVSSKKKVTFTGFGVFQTVGRKARTGVNPANPTQKINIPARTVVKFKVGKRFSEMVK